MPKFDFHFDIAAILLASVLTVLGVSAAQAGGKRGIAPGNFGTSAFADSVAGSKPGGGTEGRSGAASSGQHGSSGQHEGADAGSITQTGGISGGVVGSYYRFGR